MKKPCSLLAAVTSVAILTSIIVVLIAAAGAALYYTNNVNTSTVSKFSSSTSTLTSKGSNCLLAPCVNGTVSYGNLCPVFHEETYTLNGSTTTVEGCPSSSTNSSSSSSIFDPFSSIMLVFSGSNILQYQVHVQLVPQGYPYPGVDSGTFYADLPAGTYRILATNCDSCSVRVYLGEMYEGNQLTVSETNITEISVIIENGLV